MGVNRCGARGRRWKALDAIHRAVAERERGTLAAILADGVDDYKLDAFIGVTAPPMRQSQKDSAAFGANLFDAER